MARERQSHSSHWGAFEAEVADGTVVAIHPYRHDPDPSPLLGNIVDSLRHRARITQPMIRAGWLDRGPGPAARRGAEPFVPVSWAAATDVLARELRRVYGEGGGPSVYGGSYGWSSAGRFHHAQSQLHRFLNCLGGYVRGEHTYSNGAQSVIMPHVVGSMREFLDRATAWSVLERHTELFVCFGGIPVKNTMVSPGGASRHPARDHLRAARERGAEFVLLSPLRDDLPELVGAEWLSIVPGSDVAVMLALAHVLVDEGLHDRAFLTRYCVGFDRFESYVLGTADGCPKTPEWAARLSEIPAATIRGLARRMAARRTLINVNYVAPARRARRAGAVAGGDAGGDARPDRVAGRRLRPGLRLARRTSAGRPCASARPRWRRDAIPSTPSSRSRGWRTCCCTRASRSTSTAGGSTYPDIRLVYWCGGNPFHHHQDLARLRRALARPETIVVHDAFWTPMARHADVVLPATMTLERNDIGGSPTTRAWSPCARPSRPGARRGATSRSSPTSRRPSASPSASPRAGTRWPGCGTSTTAGARGSPMTAARRRRSTSSGRPGSSSCPGSTTTWSCSSSSAPTPSAWPSARRAAGSRSSRRRSTGSATTIARAIRPGSSPPSGSARRAPGATRST